MLLLIAYDLHAPGRSYSDLIKAIKQAGSWCHLHESVWIVDTEDAPQDWVNRLGHHIDSNDELFVCRLACNWWSRKLAEDKVRWLKYPARTW